MRKLLTVALLCLSAAFAQPPVVRSAAPTGPAQFLQTKPDLTLSWASANEFLVSYFDFPAQTPGGTLTASTPASVSMVPCPLGVTSATSNQYFRISAGTGTAEPVLLTSVTAVGQNCLVGFTPAHNHSGAWQVASDSGGLKEASLYGGVGATIRLDAQRTILVSALAGVVLDKNNQTILGSDWTSVVKSRDGSLSNQTISANACANCVIAGFTIDGNRANGGTNPTFGNTLNVGVAGIGGSDHILIHRMQIMNSALFGILVNDTSTDTEISSNYIHHHGGVTDATGGGTGIYVYWVAASGDPAATGVRIIDNYISECHNTITTAGPGGAAAWYASGLTFSGNYCWNNFNNGGQVVAAGAFGPGQIENNIIAMGSTALTQITSGIEIQAPHQTILGNSIIGHEKGWGIALEGDPAGVDTIGASDTIIGGNNIQDAYMGIGLINAGGIVRGATITGNRIATGLPSGGTGKGVGLDSAAAGTVINGNNFLDTPTPVDDQSVDGAFTYGNYPQAANLIYGGSIASADAIHMRCGQSATITGSTTIRFILLPADTASTNGAGCMVGLISGPGASWSTGTSGAISVASFPTPGQAVLLVSDGVYFNPVTFTGLPTVSKLQYLRGSPITAILEGATFPFLIAADYNFPPQSPGGTISAGSTTKTLTPCPLGLGGSDTHHFLRISAGTGTAETVLITGGSCTSGASSGTVVFTAANSHSGAYTIASASGGIFEAMNTLPVTGGKVQLPSGTVNVYGTLIVGKGTATTQSTINAISLVGQGSGRAVDIAQPTLGGTTLLWGGASGGTVLQVLGPIGNVEIRDLMIDGNVGGADIGLDVVHSYLSTFRNLNITGWNAIGLRSQAVDFAFPLMVAGNNSNSFDTIEVSGGYGGAANIACQFGQAGVDVNSSFDFASNKITNTACLGGSGMGGEIRFADNNTFTMTSFNGSVAALKFTAVGGTGFPTSNVFYQCPILNTLTSSAAFTSVTPNFFWPLTTGEFSQNLGTITSFAAGVDSFGINFGKFKQAPLFYSVVSNPIAISNTNVETAFAKSYSIFPNAMGMVGAVVRMKAGGRLSTTGTPTITFKFYLNALPVANYILTTGSGVSNDAFSLDASFGINTTGALGALLIGPGTGTVGGFSGTNSTVASSTVGAQAIDTTIAQVLTLKVTWGTASSSNSATLDSMQLELLYPGSVQ